MGQASDLRLYDSFTTFDWCASPVLSVIIVLLLITAEG